MGTETQKNGTVSMADLREHALMWARLGALFFRFLGKIVQEHKKVSLPTTIIGAGLGFLVLFGKSGNYQLSTTFIYSDLPPKVYGEMIEKLNSLLQDKSRLSEVTALLGLTNSQIETIKKITIRDNQGRNLLNNFTNQKLPLVVSVAMDEPIAGDSLRRALIYYLNDNPFTGQRLELKKKLWQEELSFIQAKLVTLDSILANVYADSRVGSSAPATGVTIENSEGKNAYELLTFAREMMQRKSDLEQSLAYPETIYPVDNFLVLPEARLTLGSILKYSLTGAMAGFCMAAAWVFFKLYILPFIRE